MTIESVKRQLKALLATATNSGSTQGEIDNAMIAAQNLMVKFNLDTDDLQEDEDGHVIVRCSTSGVNPVLWERQLGVLTKEFFGVFVYSDTGYKQIVITGPRSVATMAADFFNEMRVLIYATAKLKFNSWARGRGQSYGVGFVHGLRQVIENQKKLTYQQSETSNSLVVQSEAIAKRRVTEAQRWLKEQGNTFKTGRQSRIKLCPVAHAEGQLDGKSTQIGVAKINS